MHDQLIILGGMGPQASVRLHEILLEQSRQFHDGTPDAYPAILHASMQIPDFIASKERIQDAVQIIRATCAQLPLSDAAAIGLACNTAHLLLDDLPLQDENFVSMIDAVVADIVRQRSQRVGLLASPYTIQTKLYENALAEQAIAVVLPSKSDTTTLNDIIHGVIAGENHERLRSQLTAIALRLQKRGADAILLGCTELPLIGVDSSLPVIDSLSSLAAAMLRKTNPVKV